MQNIKAILQERQVESPESKRPINTKWEIAKEFGEYVGISTPVVLRLFNLYGERETLSLRSWLYDIPYDRRKGGKIALAHWKLKEMKK